MSTEWQEFPLGTLTDWSSGGTPSLDNPAYWGGTIPWISAASMKTGRLYQSDRTITEEGLRNGSRIAPAGTVLLLVRGSELHKRIPIGIALLPIAFNQDVKALRPRDGMESAYLYYWLTGNEQMLLHKVENTGIGAGKLDTKLMQALPVCLPPVSEQRAIAHILGSLDDKVGLNEKMNNELESIARAIFKSWFVNFDPVWAKVEGRETDLPKHIANLFPNKIVKTEMGEIPEGWSIGSVGDVADHPRRGIQPKEISPGTPYIALEHMPKRSIALSNWDIASDLESNKFQFKKGEILFGKLRPYFHKVGVAPLDGVCSTDIVVIKPKSLSWFGFVLGHVSSDEFVEYTNSGSTGTKMPRTSWSEMTRYSVIVPSEEVAAQYQGLIGPMVDKITANIHQCQTLGDLRDMLLPRLISGKIRIKDAEKFLNKAL